MSRILYFANCNSARQPNNNDSFHSLCLDRSAIWLSSTSPVIDPSYFAIIWGWRRTIIWEFGQFGHSHDESSSSQILKIILFQASVEELKTLLSRYASTDELAMNGVTVGGTKYMYISSTDRVVRAKKGTSGLHCIKTVQGKLCVKMRHVRQETVVIN